MGKNSEEFLRNSWNCDPPKISHFWDQFWGIFREFPKNQLQERILEKFLGNSSKKVTTVGESGEITHFCYLGTYKKCASDLQKLCIQPTKRVHPTYNWCYHLTYKKCTSDLQKVYIWPKTIKVYNISDLKKVYRCLLNQLAPCSTF